MLFSISRASSQATRMASGACADHCKNIVHGERIKHRESTGSRTGILPMQLRCLMKHSHTRCLSLSVSSPMADLAVSVPLLEPLVAGVVLIGGLAGFRLWAYSKVEYITASMLANYVVKGGARVIQIGGGTRELYYYPKGTVQVMVVGDDIKKGLMTQAGIQAQIPVVVNDKLPGDANLGAGSSADAIVLIQSLPSIQNLDNFLQEVCRVLKPGAPLIFIERVTGDDIGGGLPGVSPGADSSIGTKTLQKMKVFSGFEEVNWDIALEGLDPHAVGVASKEEITIESQRKSAKKGKKQKKSGFS